MKKIFVTWQEFDDMIDELVVIIKETKINFKNIYGLPRGGLPMAVALSHKLGLPIILDITEVKFTTLVVDDISDLGTQLSDFYKSGVDIATLHSTPWTTSPPNYYVASKLKKSDWIVYPWENPND